jgi:CheY-like chemotaxis protein
MKASSLLIVEDEIILAKDMEARLIGLGYRVAGIVCTGLAAIAAAERFLPDLILMDIRLSGKMDGIEAALEIRKIRDIPVIFLSAYADETTCQRALAVGPCGFLSKITSDRDLHSAIEAALH